MTVTQCFSSVLAAWALGLNLSDHAYCYYVCVREVCKNCSQNCNQVSLWDSSNELIYLISRLKTKINLNYV
jgi:hypothetical protein